MTAINRVILLGNLARDPEREAAANGQFIGSREGGEPKP